MPVDNLGQTFRFIVEQAGGGGGGGGGENATSAAAAAPRARAVRGVNAASRTTADGRFFVLEATRDIAAGELLSLAYNWDWVVGARVPLTPEMVAEAVELRVAGGKIYVVE